MLFPVSVAVVLDVEMVPMDNVASGDKPPPPPPDAVPTVCDPSDAKNILPWATSEAVAVVGVTSVNSAVPPPCLGNRTPGTCE